APRPDAVPGQHLAAQAGVERRDRHQPPLDRDGGLPMPPVANAVEGALGIESMDLARFEVIFLRMIMACLLGAFLGYRLWRRLLPNTLPPAREDGAAQAPVGTLGGAV